MENANRKSAWFESAILLNTYCVLILIISTTNYVGTLHSKQYFFNHITTPLCKICYSIPVFPHLSWTFKCFSDHFLSNVCLPRCMSVCKLFTLWVFQNWTNFIQTLNKLSSVKGDSKLSKWSSQLFLKRK